MSGMPGPEGYHDENTRPVAQERRWPEATPTRSQVWMMGGAVAVAIAGSLLHNAREFGVEAVLAGGNGELILIAPMAAAFAAWWFMAGARTTAAWTLVGLALLNLIGGAVLTVLPLGFLPFEPEQSWEHYLSHIIYGAAQLPLIALGIRDATARKR